MEQGSPRIFDTHIHFYQPSRPTGVPWPPREAAALHRDVLPAEYRALATRHNIVAAGIVEASPDPADNFWVLDLVRGDPLFRFLVAHIDVGGPTFSGDLERLLREPRVVGVRAFLWRMPIRLDDRRRADLRSLVDAGMSLDLISRRDFNPKAAVAELSDAFPTLRIIIDHLAGAFGKTPTPAWRAEMEALARRPNVHIKFSSFFDMFGPGVETTRWESPAELTAYEAHFDVLMNTFGPSRLIWASNWPVCTLGGGFDQQIALAEAYLARFGREARDRIMFENAGRFYARQSFAPQSP